MKKPMCLLTIFLILTCLNQGIASDSYLFNEDFDLKKDQVRYFNFTVIHQFMLVDLSIITDSSSFFVQVEIPEGFYGLDYSATTFDFEKFNFEYPSNDTFSTTHYHTLNIVLAGNYSIKLWSILGDITGHFSIQNITDQYLTAENNPSSLTDFSFSDKLTGETTSEKTSGLITPLSVMGLLILILIKRR